MRCIKRDIAACGVLFLGSVAHGDPVDHLVVFLPSLSCHVGAQASSGATARVRRHCCPFSETFKAVWLKR